MRANKDHDNILNLPDLQRMEVGRTWLEHKIKKKNPNSLRFMLGYLLLYGFNGNRTKAINAMKQFGGTYPDPRRDREGKTMNEKLLSKILNDDILIAYWHIEVFARMFKIPSGALLLASRLSADVRKSNTADARALVNGIRRFADVLAKIIDTERITAETIDEFQACFSGLYQEQLDLLQSREPGKHSEDEQGTSF